MIKLIVKDNRLVFIRKDVIKESKVIQTILLENDNNSYDEINIPNVDLKNMTWIIHFLTQYVENPFPEIPKPINSDNICDYIPQFYANVISELNDDELSELICNANYLHIDPILDVLSLEFAIRLKRIPVTVLNELLALNS
jgi:hypothetical protein